MKRLNHAPWFDPASLVPLVGFDKLPHGWQFQINMYQFGQIRCHAIVSADCLAECFDVVGVGQCPRLIHEAIYEQAHGGQVCLSWMNIDDLPMLIEVFSRYPVEWVHFDA